MAANQKIHHLWIVFSVVGSAIASSHLQAATHASNGLSASAPIEATKGLTVEESTGRKIDLGAFRFKNERGESVTIAQSMIPGKPLILSFGYYKCPGLCGLILNGLVKGVKELSFVPGKDFTMINVSINSKETPQLADEKRTNFLKLLSRDDLNEKTPSSPWSFWVGEESQVTGLTKAIGYGFRWIESEQEFAHGSAVYILTPEGVVSRIFYGIEYPTSQLKLSLLEASQGKIGTIMDRLILFCYQYNPELKKYSMVLSKVMQLAALLTVAALALVLGVLWRGNRTAQAVVSGRK